MIKRYTKGQYTVELMFDKSRDQFFLMVYNWKKNKHFQSVLFDREDHVEALQHFSDYQYFIENIAD